MRYWAELILRIRFGGPHAPVPRPPLYRGVAIVPRDHWTEQGIPLRDQRACQGSIRTDLPRLAREVLPFILCCHVCVSLRPHCALIAPPLRPNSATSASTSTSSFTNSATSRYQTATLDHHTPVIQFSSPFSYLPSNYYVPKLTYRWYWFPGYIFQALSTFSWMTWIAPDNANLTTVTGFWSGMGLNPWPTFDYNNLGRV